MSCQDCQLEATGDAQRRVLITLLAINATMFAVEIIVGVFAQSAGVVADSLDMLADALVYGVSLYAIGKATTLKHRAAAWAGWCQLTLALIIAVDVGRRTIFGSEPETAQMMIVSIVALLANAYCLRLLQQHRDGEVHMRASWIFTRTDVIANVGVILAAVLVRFTGSRVPDLVVGAAIVGVVIKGGVEILRTASPEVTILPVPVEKQ